MIHNLSLEVFIFFPCFFISLSLSFFFLPNAQMNTANISLLLLIINQLIHHMLNRDMLSRDMLSMDMFIVYIFHSKFEYFMNVFQFLIMFFFQKVQSYFEWMQNIILKIISIHTQVFSFAIY